MAEKKIKWTGQQRRAIAARGSDVLVTASAGTGKTAVLSGRCVDIVSDKSICPDVLSTLVLTFTNAAADQMRERIAQQLTAASTATRDIHLRRQLIMLAGADISTIDSFCKRLITQYFYELGIDPTFTIIEGDEQKLLKAEVLEKTIDWAWQQSNLAAALEQLLYKRDLRTGAGFLSQVIQISSFLDAVAGRQNWYERTTALLDALNPFGTTLGARQKEIIANKLHNTLRQLRHAQKLYESHTGSNNWSTDYVSPNVELVTRCIKALQGSDWEDCVEIIKNFEKTTIRTPKDADSDIAGLIKKVADDAMIDFGRLSQLATVNPDYLDKVNAASNLQTKVLVELVRKFDQLYSHARQSLNCMDFADLERYTLTLLTNEESTSEKLAPSEIALALRKKYKHIFVDEYQDINPVQQAILKMLSSAGNIFVVGDVKQSIYAFRGAEPKIFLENLNSASTQPGSATDGLRVDLNLNFRSTKGILDFVNKVFSGIMTSAIADIDYDEPAKLKPAIEQKVQSQPQSAVELHIIDSHDKDNTSGDIYSSRHLQAAMIAQRIKQIVGAETGKAEFQIIDNKSGTERPLQYGDIVILMRAPAKRINDYMEVLRLANVPVSAEASAGYFEATEISDMLCLLKVLDNHQRDIELAAVLRSPLFNITDSQLAHIKVNSKPKAGRVGFYELVLAYISHGPDAELVEKLKNVQQQIQRWRKTARQGNLADLIWQVYRQTNFLSFVSALPNGRVRRANLLKLHDRAIQFEGFASSEGIASLTRFVSFIEKMQESGQDWGSAEPQSQTENAVRIISVHKSKGLEFPIVFLAELNSNFNRADMTSDCLADAGGALGLRIIDRQTNSKLSSLAHQVIAEQKMATNRAEEMRILYVAATRAKNKLILTASESKKHCRDVIYNGFFFGGEPVPAWQLRRCKNPLEWILYGLCDQKNLHEVFKTPLADKGKDDKLFNMTLYSDNQLEEFSRYIKDLRDAKAKSIRKPAGKVSARPAVKKLLSQVKESLAWQYKFGVAPLLPAKRSVTQLTHWDDEYVKIDYSMALERSSDELPAGAADGRLVGTAVHLVITRLDLKKPVTEQTVEKTKEKLLADGNISEAVAEQIDTKSITAFFESELGKQVADAYPAVLREWLFTFSMPASQLENLPLVRDRRYEIRDTIVVQGIIDMLVQTPHGLLVIDFKTDRITADETSQRAALYRHQLQLYAQAAQTILETNVIAKWLYFLTPRCPIKVE